MICVPSQQPGFKHHGCFTVRLHRIYSGSPMNADPDQRIRNNFYIVRWDHGTSSKCILRIDGNSIPPLF
jgi:hypothetical protein